MLTFESIDSLPKDTKHFVLSEAQKKHTNLTNPPTHVWLKNDIIKGYIYISKREDYSLEIKVSSRSEKITAEEYHDIICFISDNA